MRRQDLIAFAARDWPAIAESKARHWLERKRRLGTAEAFRVAAELRRFVMVTRPEWPGSDERAADLERHAAVAESLRRVRTSGRR
jgi:hypothetical protein